MSLHISKHNAEVAALDREVAAQRLANSYKHSSGHKYRRFGVERAFVFFWRDFEYSPPQRPRVEE